MNFTKLRELWAALSMRQRVQITVALGTTLALVWGFTLYANRIRYGVLFSNLPNDDAASIIAELKDRHIDYRLSANGTIVEVPVQRIDELRLDLAGEGLTPGGGVGFEIFDKPAFGLSNFVQKINYQRALERELGRTIQSLDSVSAARVHLALPAESVFADERHDPTASVVVRLRPGKVMAKERIQSIVNLVATGVEGLSPERVSVVDSDGRLLSGGEDDSSRMSAGQYEGKKAYEDHIEKTLVALLEPLVGRGKVRARATVQLNLTRVDRVEEVYDPNGTVVRSEQKTKNSGAANGPAGVPGTASNLGGAGPASGSSGQQAQSSLTNFEINKTISTISEPMGTLARQSVAVVIDNMLVEPTGADGNAEPVSTPRSTADMQKISDLVRAAIGFDETRRDTLIVENVPFETPPEVEAIDEGLVGLLSPLLRYGSLPLAVLLLALFVIRPGISAIRNLGNSEGGGGSGPPTVAQLQAQILSGGETNPQLAGGATSPLRQRLAEAITEDPETAARVVRLWMNE